MTSILILLLIALNVADVLLTLRNIKQGGRELNPLLAWLMTRIGIKPALIVSKTILLAAAVLVLRSPAIITILCLAYAAVVWHNWRQLRQ